MSWDRFADQVSSRLGGYAAAEEVRRAELRALSEWDAAVIADDLLQLLDLLPPVERECGLVEQQRIFARLR